MPRPLSERGQVVPALAGAIVVLIVLVLGLGSVGAAIVAKGRAQRAADLSAISAATVLSEERWRVGQPRFRSDGTPNPDWLSRSALEAMARKAAVEAARRNRMPDRSVHVELVAYRDWIPSRVNVSIAAEAGLARSERVPIEATASAEAVPIEQPLARAIASGGGYSGPLEYRDGEGIRPDAARAFDRMAAAASRAGIPLVVTSGFRSDAEQAALFARNPDPRWVAPPGQSLHRCATELDLGPPSAYGWLAANAGRFGFSKRYSWEPWHFGFVDGPEPCAAPIRHPPARRSPSGRIGDGRSAAAGLPSWVPGAYREPILRAAAANGVSARLLAAQLSAESGFDPTAVSPAGAQGIAQFMPATAAAVGLRDPFDPRQAIAAQGRLMGALLRQFGSPTLALAAYNAGPGAVAGCNCVPPYPETRAYVAQISGLLGTGVPETGAWQPATTVRLVA